MKKLIISLILGVVLGLSGIVYAAPGSVTLDANNDAGNIYTDGIGLFFESGKYEFLVSSGAWGDWWGDGGYFWSMNIYHPGTGTTYSLGNSTTYASGNDALLAHSGGKVTIDHSSGGDLWFYVPESSGWNNVGSVTAGVNNITELPAVVPEPVSTILFLTGGAVMAGRRFFKRKNN